MQVRFLPQSIQLGFNMVVCIIYLILLNVVSPYLLAEHERLHMMAQIDLFLFLLAGYVMLRAHAQQTLTDDIVLSVFLIISSLITFAVFLKYAYRKLIDLGKTMLGVLPSAKNTLCGCCASCSCCNNNQKEQPSSSLVS